MTADKPYTADDLVEWVARLTHESIATVTIRKHVNEVIYGESERCAECAELIAHLAETEPSCIDHGIARRFKAYARDILATSPGKGGG